MLSIKYHTKILSLFNYELRYYCMSRKIVVIHIKFWSVIALYSRLFLLYLCFYRVEI
jgi:hypothetical protein